MKNDNYKKKKITYQVKNPTTIIQLKECPRIKHSDIPLKKPTKKCIFRKKHKRECIMHPSLIIYLNTNNIEYDFWTKYKCVLRINK